MNELDDVRRLHVLGTTGSGGWITTCAALASNAAVERAEIDAFLAKHGPHVPRTRRLWSIGAPLYEGKTKTEPRVALFDHIAVDKSAAIDPKKLARLLADPHASQVTSFGLGDAKSAAVLLEGLSGSTVERVQALELNSPAPEVLKGLLAHPKLASLEVLQIGGDARALGDERLSIIVEAPVVASLRRVRLAGLDKITEASWKRLAAAPFAQLASAALGSGTWIPRGTVRHHLFRASWLRGLRVLELDSVDEAELTMLRESVPFASLIALGLQFRTGNTPAPAGIGDEVVTHLRDCQALSLSNTTPAAVPALVASGILPELEDLRMAGGNDPALVAGGLATALALARHQADSGFVWRFV